MCFTVFFFESFFHFLSYYLLGIFFCQIKEQHFEKIYAYQKQIFKYFLLGFLFSSVVFLIIPVSSRNYAGFTKLLSCVAFYFLFLLYEKKISDKKFLHRIFIFLAHYSFGLFFIHECFVNLFNFHTLYELNTTPMFVKLSETTWSNFCVGLLFFLAVIALSCVTLVVLKFILKCLKVKHIRWFIGV